MSTFNWGCTPWPKDNTMDILNLQFTSSEAEKQLIIFTVGNEEYGLDVFVFKKLPVCYANQNTHAPDYVEGVIISVAR